jgi:hypothetical protein
MQGTLNEDTLDNVIYELGTKAKEMEKEQIIDARDALFNGTADKYYTETFKSE